MNKHGFPSSAMVVNTAASLYIYCLADRLGSAGSTMSRLGGDSSCGYFVLLGWCIPAVCTVLCWVESLLVDTFIAAGVVYAVTPTSFMHASPFCRVYLNVSADPELVCAAHISNSAAWTCFDGFKRRDAANEDMALAVNEAACSAAEGPPHLVPSTLLWFLPVRKPTPVVRAALRDHYSISPYHSETEWVVPTPAVLHWILLPEPASYLPRQLRPLTFEEPLVYGLHPRPLGRMDTTHGGFHVESPVGPDDAPTPTADAAGRAEDPALLTSLSAKLDRVKKLEKTLQKDAGAGGGDTTRVTMSSSDDVEEREEEEVPLRRKAPLPELDIPAEFVAEDAQARK
ncbi:hypothetical protein Tco_0972110 [Tanacetum coccineum]